MVIETHSDHETAVEPTIGTNLCCSGDDKLVVNRFSCLSLSLHADWSMNMTMYGLIL